MIKTNDIFACRFLFFVMAFYVGLWTIRIPTIKDQIQSDYLGIGFIMATFAIGSIIAMVFVNQIISDEEFFQERKRLKHCMPQLKESYYYRKIFESFFGHHDKLVPHFWMPKWVDSNDPSARELEGYSE